MARLLLWIVKAFILCITIKQAFPTGFDPPLLIFSAGDAVCRQNDPLLEGQDTTRNKSLCLLKGFSNQIRTIASHVVKRILFFSLHNEPTVIQSATLAPGQKAAVVTRSYAEALAVDWVTDSLYWADPTNSHIVVSRLNGLYPVVVVQGKPRGLALNPLTGRMYWCSMDSSPRIKESRMDGTFLRDLVTTGLRQPRQLALDHESNRLFWSDSDASTVTSVSISSLSDRKTVISKPGAQIWGVALFQGFVAWTESSPATGLHWRRLNGSDSSTLRVQSNNGYDVIAYDTQAQPSSGSNPCGIRNGGCEHLCLLTSSSAKVCRCSHGYTLSADGTCVSRPVSDNFLLVADTSHHRLMQVDLQTNLVHAVDLPVIQNPIGVEYDGRHQRVYWSDVNERAIYSAFLNGTDMRQLSSVFHGIAADGIALDHTANLLYYANILVGSVGVMPLQGLKTKTLITSPLSKPRDIELDIGQRQMYITDWVVPAKIYRADMAGSNMKVFVTGNMVWPNGMAIDHSGKRLFWCDGHLDRVEQINLDGTGRKIILNEPGSHFYGIDFSANYLFISDWQHRKIRRLRPGDTSGVFFTPAAFARPNDLMVYRSADARGTSPCSNNNGGCSDLCLPVPSGHKCACPDGIQLNLDERTCFGSQPNVCSDLPIPAHAQRTNCPPQSTVGTTCLYSCIDGYQRTSGSESRTCQTDLTWSGTSLVCTINACKPLTTPEHAQSTVCSSPSTAGTSCTFVCQDGYQRSRGDGTRTCNSDLTWSGTPLVCKVKQCLPFPSPPNAQPVDCSSTSVIGSSCRYVCRDGYQHTSGNETRVCLEDLSWSGSILICREIKECLGHVNDGALSSTCRRSSGETCEFSCISGYEKTVERLTCVNGHWNTDITRVCRVITCPVLPTPANAKKVSCPSSVLVGSTCLFVCDSGYQKTEGDVTRTCTESKTWSGKPLTCKALQSSAAPTVQPGVPVHIVAPAVVVGLLVLIVTAIVAGVCIYKRRQNTPRYVDDAGYDIPIPRERHEHHPYDNPMFMERPKSDNPYEQLDI